MLPRFIVGKRDLAVLMAEIALVQGVEESAIRTGVRKREVVRARKLFSQVAVRRRGDSGAAVGRFLGLTTSAVNRQAGQEELTDCANYR